jgi:hypothetical protein
LLHAAKHFTSQQGTDSRRRDYPPPIVQRYGITENLPQSPIDLETQNISQRFEKHVEISADVSKLEIDRAKCDHSA